MIIDHVPHGDRDHGRGEVGQAHVGVNGIVKDQVRGGKSVVFNG